MTPNKRPVKKEGSVLNDLLDLPEMIHEGAKEILGDKAYSRIMEEKEMRDIGKSVFEWFLNNERLKSLGERGSSSLETFLKMKHPSIVMILNECYPNRNKRKKRERIIEEDER